MDSDSKRQRADLVQRDFGRPMRKPSLTERAASESSSFRRPPAQDPGSMHAGRTAGAKRYQLGVVAGAGVMNI